MHYHNITKDDMKNGAGLRAVLWVSGCEHKCLECQNPITWDPEGGLEFDDAAEQELFSIIEKDYISGLTLSGGDPLYCTNIDVLTKLCIKVKNKFPNKTIWLYTGYEWESIIQYDIVKYLDVIVDGKYDKSCRDIKLKWRGSNNQRVIDVIESLRNNCCVLYCD